MSIKKGFDLAAYKKSIEAADTPLKPNIYVDLNDAMQEVLGLPGLPLGHVTQIFGLSDSGKTSLAFHTAAQAQKQKVLPVFIVTEGKISIERAKAMGVDMDNCIVEYATYLEDIFKKVDRYIADAGNGNLPLDVMIFVDSIGNSLSHDSVVENKDGTFETGGAMMKAAKVIREKMRVCSQRINNTRKMSSPNTVGLVFINHAYTKPPAFPGAMASLVPYGGDGIFYSSSLVIKTKKSKSLKATVDGKDMTFGIISKLSVEKNHISNVSNAGEFVVVPDDIIPNEPGAVKEYKETHKDQWGDIEFEERDTE